MAIIDSPGVERYEIGAAAPKLLTFSFDYLPATCPYFKTYTAEVRTFAPDATDSTVGTLGASVLDTSAWFYLVDDEAQTNP